MQSLDRAPVFPAFPTRCRIRLGKGAFFDGRSIQFHPVPILSVFLSLPTKQSVWRAERRGTSLSKNVIHRFQGFHGFPNGTCLPPRHRVNSPASRPSTFDFTVIPKHRSPNYRSPVFFPTFDFQTFRPSTSFLPMECATSRLRRQGYFLMFETITRPRGFRG